MSWSYYLTQLRRVVQVSLVIWICAALLSACGTGTQRKLNIVGLIDFSGSLSEQTVIRYIDIISRELVANLDEKDQLVVLPIDEAAKREPVRIVFEDMSKNKFSLPTDGVAHACERRVKRIREYAAGAAPRIEVEIKRQKEARKKFTYYSDILSAVEQAAVLLRKEERQESFGDALVRFLSGKRRLISDRMLVVLSDMIQESPDYNFAKLAGPASSEASRILIELRERGRIPDLKGTKIFVHGRTGNSNLQIENIERFWRKYFAATQGELVAYGFDSGHEISSYLLERRKDC